MYRMLIMVMFGLLVACSMPSNSTPTQNQDVEQALEFSPGMGQGMRRGMASGMMERHHASIPDDYAGLRNPSSDDPASIERGQELYDLHCVSCHGETGMGEGAAGAVLDPPASPVAHTSLMLADDYLYWRVSEGGVPFGSAMPAWKEILDEQQRWDVINYMRALGRDGADAIATAQAERQEQMLELALQPGSGSNGKGVLTQEQVDAFRVVHDSLEAYMKSQRPLVGSVDEREQAALEALIQEGKITTEQAEIFQIAHDLLAQAGLMP